MMEKATQAKADELFQRITDMEIASRRNALLESGILIECTAAAKKAGITEYKVGMTRTLWKELYPFAEDAVKGSTFEEMLWDLFKLFKKELCRGPQSQGNYGEFSIVAKTHVKKVVGEKVETFANGKSRDKLITVMVTFIPDEKRNPSLVFGIKEMKWMR